MISAFDQVGYVGRVSERVAVEPAAGMVVRPRVAMAADGQRLVVVGARGARQVDARTGASRMLLDVPPRFAACFRDETWVIAAASRLHRFDRAGRAIEPAQLLPEASELAAVRHGEPTVVAGGFGGWSATRVRDGVRTQTRDAATIAAFPLDDRAVLEQHKDGVRLRRPSGDTAVPLPGDMLTSARVVGAALVFGGAALALELRGRLGHHLLVTRLRGGVLWRLRLEAIAHVQIAEACDRAVMLRDGCELVELDLRLGRVLRTVALAGPRSAIGVDAAGRCAAVVGDEDELEMIALDRASRRRATEEIEAPDAIAASDAVETPDTAAVPDTAQAVAVATDTAPLIEAAPPIASETRTTSSPTHASETRTASPHADDDARRALHAILGAARLRRLERPEDGGVLDDEERAAYLADWRALVAAWCRRAAAEAWDRGRITSECGPLPFATELDALLDGAAGRAPERLQEARVVERLAQARFSRWRRDGAPHVELARELGLDASAMLVLHVAAAPALWGELARAFAIIGNDPARAACDELTVAQVLGLDDTMRATLARALDPSAPLVAHGVVQLGAGRRPFREIVVAPAIVRRLAGEPAPDGEPGLVVGHDGAPPLEQLRLPDAVVALIMALTRPGPAPRVILQGRTGAGRRTLAAALAARAGRRLGVIELALHDEAPERRLVAALQGAHLRGWIPCVSGLERVDDAALRARLTDALLRHPGPLFLRVGEGPVPMIDPAALVLELSVGDLAARTRAWADELGAAGHATDAAPALAQRYAVGNGTIHRAVAQLEAAPLEAPPDSVAPVVDEPGFAGRGSTAAWQCGVVDAAMRQLRASRLGSIASRVTELASWDSVILPPEIADAAHDFVARVRHRATVLDSWGLAAVATTARGATALLQGGPGTGKTLLAGAIARDLGYELYRIDLSRVMSKWLGETEKNLSAAFDAAEEGECVLLFDEADALFTKRTEVKSSNDRYANVEVDYLLQRLDAFTGVAVLTTNFGTSIDPAFRRRLALRLTLPFPDAAQRVALWRAHLPARVPVEPGIDLDALAERYAMSGGYIRNAALRAAFRAAERHTSIDSALLVSAIEAEYRDGGRLDAIGVLE